MKSGLYCSAGYDWFSIGSEGRVSTCNALIYRTDSGIYLGNILKDNIKLRKSGTWFRCPNQNCQQICDRHWSKKIVVGDAGEIVDRQDIVNPSAYDGLTHPVSILFAPLWKCNYSCKYCILPTKETYKDLPDVCDTYPPEEWIRAFDNFFNINDIDGGIWHTNGGEPLYYDGIEKLFNYFFNRKFKIALTTNVSADVYKKIINSAPPEAFGAINCSCHPSDKNFRWELFKNRVHLLKVMGYPVSVNFVGHPDQIMLAMEYSKWCQDIGVGFSLIPLLGKHDGFEFKTVDDYPVPLKNIVDKLSNENLTDKNKFLNGKRVGS
jgi:hypothetical protein